MTSAKKATLRAEVQKHFDDALRFHQAGQLVNAELLYKKILNLDPKHADSLHLLGVIAHQTGHLDDAVHLIAQAIQIRKDVPVYYSNLGNALKDQHKFDEAIIRYRQAIALYPNFAEAHYNLAAALQDQNKIDDAITHYKKAVEIIPNLAAGYNNLGTSYRSKGNLDEAIAYLKKAIACKPNLAEAYYNLGTVYKDRGAFEAAAELYRQALTLKPNYVEAHNNLGAVISFQNNIIEAISQFDAALAIKRDHVESHVNKGMSLLLSGDFSNGWREYEWRLRLKDSKWDAQTTPQWDGGALHSKTILLFCEQGFGDSIQFIRYVPMVKALGCRVLLACPRPLARLLSSVKGIDQIFPDGIGITAHDCFAPLLSLPKVFDTRLETIPHEIPYLSAPQDLIDQWASRLQPFDGMRVGLVWAGNSRLKNPDAFAVDQRRSLKLDQLASLASMPKVQFVSLQKDATSEQLGSVFGLTLTDLMDQAKDFADTAALIANLDLVIGVDTAVIHLAAALGKPVWVLSRFDGCWRWLFDRTDSPWYPTLRLFKQKQPGNWDDVVRDVRSNLEMFAEKI